MTEHYSNAEWPEGTYSNMYGKPVSSDKNGSYNSAFQVCKGLEREGFGGDRQVFPVRTWVSEEEGGEAIRPVLSVESNGREAANPPMSLDIEAPLPLTAQEVIAAADRREVDALMGILDQSMRRELPDFREISPSGWMMDDLLAPRRRRDSGCPISMPIGSVSETPEKPLTKRDRQRLKKKMKKNKFY